MSGKADHEPSHFNAGVGGMFSLMGAVVHRRPPNGPRRRWSSGEHGCAPGEDLVLELEGRQKSAKQIRDSWWSPSVTARDTIK